MFPDLVLGVGLALGAAVVFGLGSAAQQQAAARVPRDTQLVRDPRWATGLAGVGIGLALQLVALAFAPVALVQPLGVTSVLVAALVAGQGRPWGALVCAGGLGAFLLLARPNPALGPTPAWPAGLPLAVALAVAVVGTLLVARRHAVALGVAAGIFYGVSAGLLKVVAEQVRTGGVAEPFWHPAVYAAAVIGPVGFVLSQHAFRRARSAAPVLAALTTVDPVVAVAVGVGWLGERVVLTPVALVGQALAALAVVGGVVAVARAGEKVAVAR